MSYDALDLDAVQVLVRSHGYALLKARYEQMLERRRLELEHRDAPEARGAVRELRAVLDVPAVLITEIRATLHKNDRRRKPRPRESRG